MNVGINQDVSKMAVGIGTTGSAERAIAPNPKENAETGQFFAGYRQVDHWDDQWIHWIDLPE